MFKVQPYPFNLGLKCKTTSWLKISANTGSGTCMCTHISMQLEENFKDKIGSFNYSLPFSRFI